jgi:L-ascorbate metabolism protein UlaG (beta-lactamase superfamily)
MSGVVIRYVGGPTAVVEYGELRFLLDPTFDPPGEYPIGQRALTKTQGPAFAPGDLARIDAVLLSHDQHPDNLDRAGREYLATAPRVLSTVAAASRLAGTVEAVGNWVSVELHADGGPIKVTGVPAQHGPPGSDALVGEVTGFMLSRDELPTTYVSGDNASLDVVRTIADRLGPVDIALLFAGGARTPLAGGEPLTLTSDLAAEAVQILGRPPTVVLHFEGWAHFTEGADSLRASFEKHGLSGCLHIPAPGETIRL